MPALGAVANVSVVPLAVYEAVGACTTPPIVTRSAVSVLAVTERDNVKTVVLPLPLNTSSPKIGLLIMLPT